jgi:hypothetical protein
MNRCATTPRHSIIFDSFIDDGMMGYEATTELDHDKVVYIFRTFLSIDTYTPRKYDNVCYKNRLPLINKTEMQMNAANPPSNPYPSPDSSSDNTFYPLPYP